MSEATDKITLFRKFGLHASADALAYREGKTCRTCVHLDSDPRDEPCATCRGFERWQDARAEQSKASDGVMASDDSQLDDAVTVAMFKAASQVKDNPVTRDVPSGKLHEFLMAFARALGVTVPGEASAWWALVMCAAASIEDAANCLRDPDAKKQADGAAKHYREAAQKLMTAPGVPAADERQQFEAAMGEALKTDQGAYALSRAHLPDQPYTFLATKWAWSAWQRARGVLASDGSQQ